MTRLITEQRDDGDGRSEYLAKAHGWGVRRLIKDGVKMRQYLKSRPKPSMNRWFSSTISSSSFSRYACLVAEPSTSTPKLDDGVVEVVNVTVLREDVVLRHVGAEEYLYVSGIAVSESFRTRKVATALLQAYDELCIRWGYQHLVLRAHEDDCGARTLYANAGYRVVTGDTMWVSWIGKRRRVLMIKNIW